MDAGNGMAAIRPASSAAANSSGAGRWEDGWKNCFEVMEKPQMAKILKPGTVRGATIEKFKLTKDRVFLDNLRYIRDRASFMVVQPGTYCKLITGRGLEMSDTQMEWRTNLPFLRSANGHVLIAGLGLGFIIVALVNNPQVESITVVELNQDVIDLVAPQVEHKKLTVVHGDIEQYRDNLKGRKFDAIYFDIWPDICTDNIPQMNRLHRMYRPFLNHENPKHYIGSWTREILLERRRYERRMGW